jgi:hypothetical protein
MKNDGETDVPSLAFVQRNAKETPKHGGPVKHASNERPTACAQ